MADRRGVPRGRRPAAGRGAAHQGAGRLRRGADALRDRTASTSIPRCATRSSRASSTSTCRPTPASSCRGSSRSATTRAGSPTSPFPTRWTSRRRCWSTRGRLRNQPPSPDGLRRAKGLRVRCAGITPTDVLPTSTCRRRLRIASSRCRRICRPGASPVAWCHARRHHPGRGCAGRNARSTPLLTTAAASASPLQAMAVRALGRLERPGLVALLLPLIDAQAAAVRAEAASALAQSAGADPAAVRDVRERLMARLADERDAEVRGAIAESLGRLPIDSPAVAGATEKTLGEIATRFEVVKHVGKSAAGGRVVGLSLTSAKAVEVPMPALLGALRGLESFARGRARAKQSLLPDTIYLLKMLSLARPPTESQGANPQSVRRPGASAGAPVPAVLERGRRGDGRAGPGRRRRPGPSSRREFAFRKPRDACEGIEGLVVAGAVRSAPGYGRRFQAAEGCAPIVAAVGAATDHVSLLAIDLLGNPCRPEDKAVETLLDLMAGVGSIGLARPCARAGGGRQGLARAVPADAGQVRQSPAVADSDVCRHRRGEPVRCCRAPHPGGRFERQRPRSGGERSFADGRARRRRGLREGAGRRRLPVGDDRRQGAGRQPGSGGGRSGAGWRPRAPHRAR